MDVDKSFIYEKVQTLATSIVTVSLFVALADKGILGENGIQPCGLFHTVYQRLDMGNEE